MYRYVEDVVQAEKLNDIAKRAGDAGAGPSVFLSVGRHSLVEYLDGEVLFDGVNGVESSFCRCCRHRACLSDRRFFAKFLHSLPRVMRACGVLRRPQYNSPSNSAVMRAAGAAVGRMHRMMAHFESKKCCLDRSGPHSTAFLFPNYADEILQGRVHGRSLQAQLLFHCGAIPLICAGLVLWSWDLTVFDTALLRKALGISAVLAGLRLGMIFARKCCALLLLLFSMTTTTTQTPS